MTFMRVERIVALKISSLTPLAKKSVFEFVYEHTKSICFFFAINRNKLRKIDIDQLFK